MIDQKAPEAHLPLDQNHRRIWLSPACDDERTWCQDDPGPCDDCGAPSVEYVRADLAFTASTIERLTAELETERHAHAVVMQAVAAVQSSTDARLSAAEVTVAELRAKMQTHASALAAHVYVAPWDIEKVLTGKLVHTTLSRERIVPEDIALYTSPIEAEALERAAAWCDEQKKATLDGGAESAFGRAAAHLRALTALQVDKA